MCSSKFEDNTEGNNTALTLSMLVLKANEERDDEVEGEGEKEEEKMVGMPKKAGNPILNKK